MVDLGTRLDELRRLGRTGLARGPSVGAIALAATADAPDRHIVVDGHRSLTRAEMLDLACRLGGGLLSQGLLPGATVAFQLPNWWEACVVNLAASLFGFRIVPLLTIYRDAELGTMLPACGVEAMFVPKSYRGKDFLTLVSGLSARPKHLFTVRAADEGQLSFESLLRHEPVSPALPGDDDIKMILFTSGSTGRPKGVLHSHASIHSVVSTIGAFWGIGESDRLYIPSPIAHVGGSIYAFEYPWITGCTAVLAEQWDPNVAVCDIDERGCTFMAGATPFLAGLIEASQRKGTQLASLRRFICGGASVPPQLVRRGLEWFPNAVVSRAYGSSEVPLVCPGIRDRVDAEVHAETDGEVDAELRLLDIDGGIVAEGEPGEIAVRSPRMFLGYLDGGDDQGSFIDGGFFMMGDLGRRVDGKYLQITGRTKDIIIRKGENISPLEIENALSRHDSVRQSAVVGVPDPERGEMVVAFVIPKEGRSFSFAEMIAHLDQFRMARQKFPERLEVVSSLPLNSVGKVQKVELRARALQPGDDG